MNAMNLDEEAYVRKQLDRLDFTETATEPPPAPNVSVHQRRALNVSVLSHSSSGGE